MLNQLDSYADCCYSNQQTVFLQNGTLACSLQTLSVHVFVNFCLYVLHKSKDICFETQPCTVLEGGIKSLFVCKFLNSMLIVNSVKGCFLAVYWLHTFSRFLDFINTEQKKKNTLNIKNQNSLVAQYTHAYLFI
jgi:hypothetical protein